LAGYSEAIGEFHGAKETLRVKFKDVEVWVAVFAVAVFAVPVVAFLSFFRTAVGLLPFTALFHVRALTEGPHRSASQEGHGWRRSV